MLLLQLLGQVFFLSMIQFRLSVYIHRHLASRHSTDVLSTMGACAFYSEASQYEVSAMVGDLPNV